MIVVAILVHELDLAVIHAGANELLSGLEGLLDRSSALDVAKLHANLCRAPSYLDVVIVEDLPQVAFQLDGNTLVQVAC